MNKFIGYCLIEGCERKGEKVIFEVPHDKIDAYRNEPPICPVCGEFIVGDVHDVESES